MKSAPSLQANRTEEITNFEISKTIRSTIRESGEVTKLSVAVLVDGRYTTDEEGNKTYNPRSQEELDQIATLVRSAVGYDVDRGDSVEVVNMPFTSADVDFNDGVEKIFGFEKDEVLNTAEMIMLVVMGILVVLLVLRPLVGSVVMSQKASIEAAREEAALLAAEIAPPSLTGPSSMNASVSGGGGGDGDESFMDGGSGGGGEGESMIDMQTVEGKVKASSVKKVGEIVASHPNETVAVLRNWMAQE